MCRDCADRGDLRRCFGFIGVLRLSDKLRAADPYDLSKLLVMLFQELQSSDSLGTFFSNQPADTRGRVILLNCLFLWQLARTDRPLDHAHL